LAVFNILKNIAWEIKDSVFSISGIMLLWPVALLAFIVNSLLLCSGGSSGEASEAEPHLTIVQKKGGIYTIYYNSYNYFQSTLRILYSII